jgi:hypothetical protein
MTLFVIMATAMPDPARAVGTFHWTHSTEVDFKAGKFQGVVATNLGDLKLSRSVKTLLEQDARVSAVYAMAEASDGTIYAGTGPQGVLLRIRGDEVSEAAKLEDDTSIFSLAFDASDRLLIGTGGETGKVLRIDEPGQKPREIFSADGVQYVWALASMSDGTLCAATGPQGKLYEIRPDGSNSVLLSTDENNLLSLATDGKDVVYVGTDPHGLVYRVNRKSKDVFVVHDAAESEISALALASDGTLYAGTAEASDQQESAEIAAEATQAGRPEPAATTPLPTKPPADPEPPEIPDPNPGEPDPIPKKVSMLMFAPLAEDDADSDDGAAEQAPDSMPKGSDLSSAEAPQMPSGAADAGAPREGGNAIYRIDKDGFVTEIFRQPVLVLSLLESGGTLTVGTGSEGHVYQVNPAAEETLALAKVDPRQVMSLFAAKDGRILMGLANVGGIASMASGYARSGTYTSPVLDASQISQFGRIQLHGSLPKGAGLTVSTRSGNLAEPDETGWSKWSDEVSATEFVPVTSPAARFLQYRLTFKSDDGKSTAVIDDVNVAYQVPNLAPRVDAVTVTQAVDPNAAMAAEAEGQQPPMPQGSGRQTITWEGSDPNADRLQYSLYFRSGSRAPWILLKDELTTPTHDWDTRLVADGRYQIKVIASDEMMNPKGRGKSSSRVSDPVAVDNTAPLIGDLKAEQKAGSVEISFTATDRTSTLSSFEYSVDSHEHWQTVLPSDNISDGPEENVVFSVSDLKPGPHQIAVRATDARGNQATQTVLVTVPQ